MDFYNRQEIEQENEKLNVLIARHKEIKKELAKAQRKNFMLKVKRVIYLFFDFTDSNIREE
jgi:hypothetical protein